MQTIFFKVKTFHHKKWWTSMSVGVRRGIEFCRVCRQWAERFWPQVKLNDWCGSSSKCEVTNMLVEWQKRSHWNATSLSAQRFLCNTSYALLETLEILQVYRYSRNFQVQFTTRTTTTTRTAIIIIKIIIIIIIIKIIIIIVKIIKGLLNGLED